MYIGRSRSRPARIRRSATHPLGNPAHGQDSPPAETWILIGMLPALIKQEDFKRVQVKLALNKKQATRTYARYSYLLRALVSCGACQSACIARTTNGGLRYYICRCQAQPIDSQHDQRCRARCIPAQQLDVLVWERVCQLITLPDYNIEALQRARGGQWLPQQLQSRKEILRKAQVGISQQVGKTDRGSPDGDHPTGRGPNGGGQSWSRKARRWRLKRRNWRPKSIGRRSCFSWVHRSRISAVESTPVWSMQRLTRSARWWNC